MTTVPAVIPLSGPGPRFISTNTSFFVSSTPLRRPCLAAVQSMPPSSLRVLHAPQSRLPTALPDDPTLRTRTHINIILPVPARRPGAISAPEPASSSPIAPAAIRASSSVRTPPFVCHVSRPQRPSRRLLALDRAPARRTRRARNNTARRAFRRSGSCISPRPCVPPLLIDGYSARLSRDCLQHNAPRRRRYLMQSI
jgi:hypothetical protein